MEKENQLQREARAETRGTHVTIHLKVARQQHRLTIIIKKLIAMENTPHLCQINNHTKDTKTAQHNIK